MENMKPKLGATVYAPMIKKLIGLGISQGLVVLGGVLVAHGLSDQAGWAELSLRLAPVLVAVALEAYDKLTQMALTRIAQEAPKDTRFAALKDEAKTLSVGDKLGLITTQS